MVRNLINLFGGSILLAIIFILLLLSGSWSWEPSRVGLQIIILGIHKVLVSEVLRVWIIQIIVSFHDLSLDGVNIALLMSRVSCIVWISNSTDRCRKWVPLDNWWACDEIIESGGTMVLHLIWFQRSLLVISILTKNMSFLSKLHILILIAGSYLLFDNLSFLLLIFIVLFLNKTLIEWEWKFIFFGHGDRARIILSLLFLDLSFKFILPFLTQILLFLERSHSVKLIYRLHIVVKRLACLIEIKGRTASRSWLIRVKRLRRIRRNLIRRLIWWLCHISDLVKVVVLYLTHKIVEIRSRIKVNEFLQQIVLSLCKVHVCCNRNTLCLVIMKNKGLTLILCHLFEFFFKLNY